MNVTIPDEKLEGILLSQRDALIDVGIGLYKRGEISFGRGAELAGLSVTEFHSELARRRIPINYDADDLRQDIGVLNDLPLPRVDKTKTKAQP
jgi:predicted HTH domain antitoxin